MARPNPVLVLPDPLLAGRANLVSATSEADPYTGVAVAGSTNEGDLHPSLYAHDVTAEYDYTLGIARAGGPYRTAEWRWKETSGADSTFRGVDQINFLSLPHDPWAGVSGYRNVLACCFARRQNKLFLYWAIGSGTILVRYRSAGAAPTAWSTASITLERPIVTVLLGGMVVLEMPDGSMRMLVVYGRVGAADNDVDVYGSTDGTSWTLLSRAVLSKQTGATYDIQRIRAASSGDWIRLVVLVVGTTLALVSSDRGASFKLLANLTMPSSSATPTNGQTADPYGALDLVGLDDAAGTFVLASGETTARVYLRVASRDEDWTSPQDSDNFVGTTSNVYRVCLARTATHVLLFAATWDGTASSARRLEGGFAAIDEATQIDSTASSKWRSCDWNGYGIDSADYMPRSMAACEADGSALLIFGLCDPEVSGAEVEQGALLYCQPWTSRSMWADESITVSGTAPEVMFALWDSPGGSPTSWGTSAWSAVDGGSSSETWSADYWRIQSDANGAAGIRSRALGMPNAAARAWADGGKLGCEWIVRVPTAVVGMLAGDYVATRIIGTGATAGVTVDFSVRHSATQVVLYDNQAAVAISTLAVAALSTAFHVVRASVTQHDGQRWAEVAVASVDDLSSWSTATATISSVAVATQQQLRWGALAGLAGVTSDWRRMALDEEDDWAQSGYSQPSSMRGAPVSARAWWLGSGAWVDWSGGAAFEQDNWRCRPRRRYEADNLFFPSPRAPWRSTSLASNVLVFDADPSNGSRRFAHDAVAFFGCNVRRLKVKYNDVNSGWGSPSETHHLDADLVAGLTVSSVGAGWIEVAGATLDAGAYDGLWFHYMTGPLANASITISSQVGQRLYFAPLGWTSVSPATGDSLVIHGSVLATMLNARAQYRFAWWECSSQTTAAGYYQLGTPICGITQGFDSAAVDWEHVETTLNGVDVTDGIGGVRWGFEAIPPRRSWASVARGDASNVRRAVLDLLKARVDLSVRPVAVAWDRDDLPGSCALARWSGDVELQNAGWKQQVDGTWRVVGDMPVLWDEEL